MPRKHTLQSLHGKHNFSCRTLQTLFLHSRDTPQVPLWLCSAIWVNPARVTTVTVPVHIGTGKGVNTPRTVGTMQILTTMLAGTRSHVRTPADDKPGTEWFVLGIVV